MLIGRLFNSSEVFTLDLNEERGDPPIFVDALRDFKKEIDQGKGIKLKRLTHPGLISLSHSADRDGNRSTLFENELSFGVELDLGAGIHESISFAFLIDF